MGTLLQRMTAFLIYGGKFRLRPYESDCLRMWSFSLPDKGREIFQRQVVFLDRYKRFKGGRLLFFFPTGWPNGQPLPAEVRFPLDEDESRVARLRICFPSTPRLNVSATVVLQHGQVTSVEFSKVPPREYWRQAEILEVVTLRNVLTSSDKHAEAGLGEIPASLSWLAKAYGEIKCLPPRVESEIAAFLSSFPARFPLDYETMLRLSNGISAGPLTIYGLGDVWTIPRPDGPFVSIAHIRDIGDIAAKNEGEASALYLLSSESDKVTQLPPNLSDALRQCLSAAAPDPQNRRS